MILLSCSKILYGYSNNTVTNIIINTDSICYHKVPINKCNRNNIVKILDNRYCIAYFTYKQVKNRDVKSSVLVNNNWKYTPDFNYNNSSDVHITIAVIDIIKALDYIRFSGLDKNIISTESNYITLKCSTDDIRRYLENNNNIFYIGKEENKPKPESKIPDLNHYINRIHNAHTTYNQIDGTGVNVSVKDLMFNKNDIDLLNKYIDSPFAAKEIANHATDMATLIAGHGNTSVFAKGSAPKSQLSSADYNNISPNNTHYFTDNSITIQNHSYGTKPEPFYGSTAEMYDRFCNDNPTILHIFSAGNAGQETPETGNYKGIKNYATITGNFKMAKNIIVVGAIDDLYQIPVFSSRGPAYDGRIKPDIVAYSTIGTSNSAAITTGVSALLQQQYNQTYGHMPRSAAIKAVLINSAKDINTPGPDFMSGYGSLDAEDALYTIKNKHLINNTVNKSESKNHKLTIPANCSRLKITLSWIDQPSKPNSEIALVNDIDIKITTPDGNTVLPWVLNSNASVNDLTAEATRGVDRLNNTEQITISNPKQGEYTITITAHNIVTDSQNYSIAYQHTESDNFKWISPSSESKYIYSYTDYTAIWETTYNNSVKGDLYININSSGWNSISSDISLEKELYKWNTKIPTEGTAQLKMVISGKEYISDTFTINRNIGLNTSLNCNNDIEIRWNKIDNAQSYNIYCIYNDIMTKIHSTTSTNFNFKSGQFNNSCFAVAPVMNNVQGQRSRYTDTNSKKNSCYIDSFYVLENGNKSINININLSSLHMVKRIDIYRENINKKGIIKTIQPTYLEMIIPDTSPAKGNNTYHAVVYLTDNRTYTSEYSTVLYLPENSYELFPNPVSDNTVNIYTDIKDKTDILFQLYDIRGIKLMQQKLISNRNTLDLNGIKQGLYIYKMYENGRKVKSGKLIIR